MHAALYVAKFGAGMLAHCHSPGPGSSVNAPPRTTSLHGSLQPPWLANLARLRFGHGWQSLGNLPVVAAAHGRQRGRGESHQCLVGLVLDMVEDMQGPPSNFWCVDFNIDFQSKGLIDLNLELLAA